MSAILNLLSGLLSWLLGRSKAKSEDKVAATTEGAIDELQAASEALRKQQENADVAPVDYEKDTHLNRQL